MKTKSSLLSYVYYLLFVLALSPPPSALSQVPHGFNYQALVRDGTGEIMAEEVLDVQIDIETAASTLIWSETHIAVQTTQYGLMSIVVGTGTPNGGSAPSFSEIDWNAEPLYLKTWINIGSGMVEMGTTQIWAVPYSLVAKDVEGPIEKLGIKGTTTELDEALFEVKNNTGQTVFAVYNEGVRIYVDDGEKGVKGGFSIGGFGTDKGTSQPYLIVKPDTVRVYINQSGKGVKGGFAIGGYGADKAEPQNFLFISDDSVRIYVDNADDDISKGVKGGFAIGGYGTSKGDQKFLTVSDDSVRIYINDTGKSVKGGFAIGGYGSTKGMGKSFLNVETSETGIIDPPVNRILWYPLKNAFLAGQVYIESPVDVGENSFATGYQSKAIGDYSQALGYGARAHGKYSMAIGNRADAIGENSFAFGDSAVAKGVSSFAFGSRGINWIDTTRNVTIAIGDYSTAIGMGDSATAAFAMAIGQNNTASGYGSMSIGSYNISTSTQGAAIGYQNNASNSTSYAFGCQNISSGDQSSAIGYSNEASNFRATALGTNTYATGWESISLGSVYTTASGYNSVAIGYHTIASGDYSTTIGSSIIAAGNHSFGIGLNSTSYTINDAYTMAIMGGEVGIGTTTPQGTLDVNGAIYQRGGLLHADYVFTDDYLLESIEEHSEFMWNRKHLPAVPKAKKDEEGSDIIEWGEHNRGMLEELEKAHVYIDQLNKSLNKHQIIIETQQKQIDQLMKMISEINEKIALSSR